MLRNGLKGYAMIGEIGWSLHPAGDFAEWDGLVGWFLAYVRREPGRISEDNYARDWHRAAVRALPLVGIDPEQLTEQWLHKESLS